MAILYMLIGIPASGKSFWARNAKTQSSNSIIISSDSLREELLGNVNDQSHNDMIFNEFYKRVTKELKEDKTVFADATNLNRKKRINFLKSLPPCMKIAMVFSTPYEECVRRNIERERSVPEYVLKRMYQTFIPPHYDEGFDKIFIVREGWKPSTSLFEMMKINKNCAHDNPHHSFSCGEHCQAALSYIVKDHKNILKTYNLDDYKMLCEAALYHDISKYKCKTFPDTNDNFSKIAHYYNHENISAYDYMVYSNNKDFFVINVANLIANHMIFYEGENAICARKKIYNEHFWRLLEKIHEADINAH